MSCPADTHTSPGRQKAVKCQTKRPVLALMAHVTDLDFDVLVQDDEPINLEGLLNDVDFGKHVSSD